MRSLETGGYGSISQVYRYNFKFSLNSACLFSFFASQDRSVRSAHHYVVVIIAYILLRQLHPRPHNAYTLV